MESNFRKNLILENGYACGVAFALKLVSLANLSQSEGAIARNHGTMLPSVEVDFPFVSCWLAQIRCGF
jgi:hypothetical protein